MNNKSFRNLIIDILDDPHGIEAGNYKKLMDFSTQNCPSVMDDVFNSVSGAEGRVWLDEAAAEDLRAKE